MDKLKSISGFLLGICSVAMMAQTTPRVAAVVDTLSLTIGEQMLYTIRVEADSTATVKFPEGQTFLPFEVVETFDIDTIKAKAAYNFVRQYALTQFDSGQFTIPRQRIFVNDLLYQVDSLQVEVATVEVDTVSKQFFEIKPMVVTQKNTSGWWRPYAWSLFVILALIGSYFLIIKTRQKVRERKREIPPFERAINALHAIEASSLNEQFEYKEYYSQLTDIVRNYIEDDVRIDAMESTTKELILKLELLKDSGKLSLKKETIDNFKSVLQTADLVKFARSIPGVGIAQADKAVLEVVVKETKQALPEPTEEELRKNEEYLAQLRKEKRKKQLQWSLIGSVSLLVITWGIFSFIYGVNTVNDTVFGHPTKSLLEDQWANSTYGAIPTTLSTPSVLIRQEATSPALQEFLMGNFEAPFYTKFSVEIVPKEEKEFDLQSRIEKTVSEYEAIGAKNILIKQDEFSTPNGTKGVKIYGSFDYGETSTIRRAYVILNFVEQGGYQQVQMVFDREDRYAEQIMDRITASIQFNKEE